MVHNRRTKRKSKNMCLIQAPKSPLLNHTLVHHGNLQGVHIKNQKRKKKLGFPIKDFGNDRKRLSPEVLSPLFVTLNVSIRGQY